MFPPAAISPAIVSTILAHLIPHFLASTAGDVTAARQAASQMLAAYNAESEDELRLAAEIVSFGFDALKALGQAADPDLPLTKILRLRSSAVSLSRESHKARRRLDQIRRARLAAGANTAGLVSARPTTQAQPPASPPPQVQTVQDKPPANPPEPPRTTPRETGDKGLMAWTVAGRQRSAALRITENLKRNQAEHARRQAAGAMPPPGDTANPQPRVDCVRTQ